MIIIIKIILGLIFIVLVIPFIVFINVFSIHYITLFTNIITKSNNSKSS
jgi:hypothetical protein